MSVGMAAMTLPNSETVAKMLAACTAKYKQLISDGCAEDVALDRTWDAYTCAFMQTDFHCYDPRDSLFESKLRTIRKKD